MISVCIVCRNEGDRLAPCLESVSWAAEVIVMDLSSIDDSAEIAARHGARVVTRAPVPIVEMVRNEVAAYARGEWILALDPDERITPGLATELRALARRDDIDAVVVPRTNYDLGYPPSNPGERYEPQLRMYRKARVVWPTAPNTFPVVPNERTAVVASSDDRVMIHDRSRSIPEVLDRSLRYATLQAQAMIDRSRRSVYCPRHVALVRPAQLSPARHGTGVAGRCTRDSSRRHPGRLPFLCVGSVLAALWRKASGTRRSLLTAHELAAAFPALGRERDYAPG
jgi:hypothetical protein